MKGGNRLGILWRGLLLLLLKTARFIQLMQILNQIRVDFESYLQANLFDARPSELYDPVNYIMKSGGKRLRSSILLLSCYFFNGNYVHAMPAAYAIELFHNFTLIHDDIMDNARMRRGKLSVHEKYGLNTGILSGDVAMVQAFNWLFKVGDQKLVSNLFQVFTKLAVEVCEGQQMDMNFETAEKVQIADYIKMIELKTSVLIAGAMKMGALIGGAMETDADAIYQFGRNLGISFQLQDDLLDTFGDAQKFGKKVGGDIVQNKKTYLYLKALELANESQLASLKELYRQKRLNEEDKINRVKGLFNELNIKKETEAIKEKYRKVALSYLHPLNVPDDRKAVLEDFSDLLMRREV